MRILVHHNGQQLGPFTERELRNALVSGEISRNDLAWLEGTPDWVPLGKLLRQLSATPADSAPETTPPPLQSGPGSEAESRAQERLAARRPRRTADLAVVSLVLGILSILGCLLLSGIPAVICGHMARRRIRESRGHLGGEGLALAGLITGYAGSALTLLVVIAGIAIPAFAASQERNVLTRSLIHARSLYAACKTYSIDHNDQLPGTLEDLVPHYVNDKEGLADPGFPGSGEIGYHYFGSGTRFDKESPTKLLLTSKRSLHDRYIVVQFNGDGRIDKVP